MEQFILEHGGIIFSGIIAVAVILIVFTLIRVMGNVGLFALSGIIS